MGSNKLLYWYPLLGLAFAVAGADKLLAVGSYRRLPRDLGWPMAAMRTVAAVEVVGGTLLASSRTRRLGGGMLALACGAMLSGELRHRQASLALPRLTLLLAALTAFLPAAQLAANPLRSLPQR